MTAKPKIIKINNKSYYSADALMDYSSIFFKGCNNSRAIVAKKDIPQKNFVYAVNKDDEWIETEGKSRKFDRLFLKKIWVETNIPEFSDEAKYEIGMAPEIIELKKNEKFRDNDNNIVEIEVRGEREFDKCFFKVKDIVEGFGMKYLDDNIIDKRSGYSRDVHYKYFNVQQTGNSKKKKIKTTLFLTYTGLLRVLFASHKGHADKFIKWASETLFAAQMGTKQQKNIVIAKMLGVTPEVIKSVFSKTASTLPCIYLLYLGKVKDLREILDIDNEYDDDDDVYKYGNTDDLDRRMGEHKRDFAKIGIKNIQLTQFGFIDVQYKTNAETDLKKFINAMELNLEHDTFEELAVIPKKKFPLVKQQYDTLTEIYMGHIKKINKQMDELKHQHALLKKDQEIAQEKHEKEKIELQKNNELLHKDIEIMALKMNRRNH